MKFYFFIPLMLAPLIQAEDLPEITAVNGWILQRDGNIKLVDNAVEIIPKALVLGTLSYSSDTSFSSTSTNATFYGGVEARWSPANGQRVTLDSLGSMTSNLDDDYPLSGIANLSWAMKAPSQNGAADVGIRASSSALPQTGLDYYSIAQTGSADWTLKGNRLQAGISVLVNDLRFLQSSIFWSGDQRDSTTEELVLHGAYAVSSRLDLIAVSSIESVQWASNERLQNGSASHFEGGFITRLTERLEFTLVGGAANWRFDAPYAQDPSADDQHSILPTYRASLVWKEVEDPIDASRLAISVTQDVLPGLNSNLSIYQYIDFIWYHQINSRFTVIFHSALGKAKDQGHASFYGPPESQTSLLIRPLLVMQTAHRISYNIYANSRSIEADLNGDSQDYTFGIGAGTIF